MPNPIIQIGNHVTASVLTFATLVALWGVIAASLAHRYGVQSRARRRAIFSAGDDAGMLIAAAIAFVRLRSSLGT